MTYYARGRSRTLVKVWTYAPSTLSYKEASVPGGARITTVACSDRTSRPRLKVKGGYSAPISANYASSRTVEWQADAYRAAVESGEWCAHLTDDERRYRDHRAGSASPARRTWAA